MSERPANENPPRPAVDEHTRRLQARASDPRHSAWVSANAGSGKTFVLARRVVRLLLDGVAPGRILCLTFTRAAAAEMANRVFETLGRWVMLAPEKLDAELAALGGKPLDPDRQRFARSLFAAALETPGGLKIQTIHAFCEALLQQFPLEANVPGHFSVADERRQQHLLGQARTEVFGAIASGGAKTELIAAANRLAAAASDKIIDEALDEILRHAEDFTAWYDDTRDHPLDEVWQRLGLDPNEDEAALATRLHSAITIGDEDLRQLADAAAASTSKKNRELAARIRLYLAAATPPDRLRAFGDILLKPDGEERKNLLTGALRRRFADLDARLGELVQPAKAALARLTDWRLVKDSESLFAVAEAILARYGAAKRAAGLVDYADLIERAANLLTKNAVGAWVQYKLDQGIDHVLVDESQDTSPRQWKIIEALTGDFFSGQGAATRRRTMFAVGDEKQSIFSFQGAEPGRFSAQRKFYARSVSDAGGTLEEISLRLSFRSCPDILAAVDTVFAAGDNALGVSEEETWPPHDALRQHEPGEVRIWPMFGVPVAPEPEDWLAPIDALAPGDPKIALARRMAATIEEWLRRGEKLPGMDRPLQPRDILILIRKRDAFMTALIRELKSRDLAIAGADRLALTEHIAVEDLLALGRFALQPQDDLSLAALLKSPLIGISDEQLTALAAGRENNGLYAHLCRLAEAPSPTGEIAAKCCGRLRRWIDAARDGNAFDFYAGVLGRDGARRTFAGRLGAEAEDLVDMFEEQALETPVGLPSLRQLIASLEIAAPEIKREVDTRRDEIRVITVHSAKGLEAPVVFLVDPGSLPVHPSHRPPVMRVNAGKPGAPFLWRKGKDDSAGLLEAEIGRWTRAQEAEYRRLLYVAMTRAADRLIVCGYYGKQVPVHPHWHAMVREALTPDAQVVRDASGEIREWVWKRPGERREKAPAQVAQASGPATQAETTPAWLFENARRELAPPRPISPSQASLLIRGEGDGTAAPISGEAEAFARRTTSRQRGIAIHRLLQYLPDCPSDERRATAERWLVRQFSDWPSEELNAICGEALAILDDPRLAALFSPAARAEIRVGGTVRLGERDIAVSGQIDRLVLTPDAVEFADFKSGLVSEAGVAAAERLQLALYGALLAQIHPDLALRGMLVRTRGGAVEMLDKAAIEHELAAITWA